MWGPLFEDEGGAGEGVLDDEVASSIIEAFARVDLSNGSDHQDERHEDEPRCFRCRDRTAIQQRQHLSRTSRCVWWPRQPLSQFQTSCNSSSLTLWGLASRRIWHRIEVPVADDPAVETHVVMVVVENHSRRRLPLATTTARRNFGGGPDRDRHQGGPATMTTDGPHDGSGRAGGIALMTDRDAIIECTIVGLTRDSTES